VCAAVIDLEYAVGSAACDAHERDFAHVHTRHLQCENVMQVMVMVMMMMMVMVMVIMMAMVMVMVMVMVIKMATTG
jgi:hypothetical protein